MRGVVLILAAILVFGTPVQATLGWVNGPQEADFVLHAYPHHLFVQQGANVSASITLKGFQDFEGKARLTISWNNVPSSVTYLLKPSSIGSGESSKLIIMTRNDSPTGVFHFKIEGIQGAEFARIRMVLTILPSHNPPPPPPSLDFAMSADPLNLTIVPGQSAVSTVTVSSINGFSSPVSLSIVWSSSAPKGVSTDLKPISVTPTGNSKLNITTDAITPAGIYGFHVAGTSGSITHQTPQMYLNVTKTTPPPPPPQSDFIITASPGGWDLRAGGIAPFNVTLKPVKGFNQPVVLSVSPATLLGANATLRSSTVTPPALVELEIDTNTSIITSQNYTFTITATSGSLIHKVTVYVMVEPNQPVPPSGLTVTITLSQDSITLGSKVTVSGYVTPKAGSSSLPIVLLYENVSNPEWLTLSNAVTNSTAGFNYDWTPAIAGTYAIEALWPGNSTHVGAISSIVILQVTSGTAISQPTPEFPWFWLAVAAIIIIGVATAVALRIRRQPSAGGTAPRPA